MEISLIPFIGLIIITGYIAHIFSKKSKIPESLIMILIGLAIGPIFRIVDPADYKGLAGTFATLSIIIILIDSGLDFDISSIFKKMFESFMFTVSVNILITVSIGFLLNQLFGWNILHALLLGIISSGTATVMVQSLLDGLNVNKETRHLLILESIFNDTTLIMISVILINLIKQQSMQIADSILFTFSSFLTQLLLGIGFGVFCFGLWVWLIAQIPVDKKKDYVILLGLLFTVYGIVELLGGSGVIFVLVFTLFLGNQKSLLAMFKLSEKYHSKEHMKSLRSIKIIQTDLSFFIKTFFFVFLGLVTDIKEINLKLVVMTLLIIGVMFFARYISAFFITRFNQKHKPNIMLISTMMPRGFVATLLAFLPYNEGIEIPLFTELVLLLIFSTAIISILGTIFYKGSSYHTELR